MRVDAVTTCVQWDLHCWHNESMFIGHQFKYPYRPARCGHETTGWIEAVGPGVTEFAPGDRVSAGRDHSENVQGADAQYYALPAASTIRVPAGPPPEALAPLASHNLPLERYAEGTALLEARQANKVCYWPWKS